MAQPTTMRKAIKATTGLPFALTRTLNQLSYEPLLTGPLLYILTRGPEHLRARLLSPFKTNILAKDGPARLAKIITVLKALVVLGVLKRANQALNQLALNSWNLPGFSPVSKWNWDGRAEVVVITGGCSGFGYEMVKGFAGKAKVVVLDVQDLPSELAQLPEVHYYRCDMTDFEGISTTAAEIKNRFGNPSVLINNAGIGTGKTILDTPTRSLESIMKINLSSHFVLIKEFLPGMLDAKKGHIVGIASMASFYAAAGLVDYCVTKIGVLFLMEGLRNELLSRYPNGHCIATTSVHPSWHATGIIKPFEKDLEQHGIIADPPSNVATAVVEQVMAHRTGRIYMPRSAVSSAESRSKPLWLQDIFQGNVRLNPFSKGGFQFQASGE